MGNGGQAGRRVYPCKGMLDRTLEEAKNHVLELERDLAACLLHAEHMDEALASRDVIGQAKGIIMSATGKDADAAFADLVAMSQHLNDRLRLVAERIAAESRRENA
jgi:AmiR/NasT family two-component response regulator